MFTFLLVVHVIVAIALVGVILVQRSEGGGLTGGSPTGLMSARGAGNFLTRTTTILASVFILLSIGLAAVATVSRKPDTIDASLARPAAQKPAAPANSGNGPVPLAVPGTPAPTPAAK